MPIEEHSDPLVAPVVGGTQSQPRDELMERARLHRQIMVADHAEVAQTISDLMFAYEATLAQLHPLGWETGLPLNDYGRRCYAAGKAFNEHEAFHAHNGMMAALAERDEARAELAALVPRPEPREPEPQTMTDGGQMETFVDTPLLQAKRRAFDSPTQTNLDALIEVAQAAAVRPVLSAPSLEPNARQSTDATLHATVQRVVDRVFYDIACFGSRDDDPQQNIDIKAAMQDVAYRMLSWAANRDAASAPSRPLEEQFAEFIKQFGCTWEHGAVSSTKGTPFVDGVTWAFAQTFDFLRVLVPGGDPQEP